MPRAVKRRAYVSAVRQEQAALTRTRILEAADELFASAGYATTTIKRIADRADVAANTVYTIFGSKARVLTALLDLRLTQSAEVTSALDLSEAVAIREETDQRRQIALYVRFVVLTMERVDRVYTIMRSAAAVDDEMSSILAEMEGYRARNAKTIAGWFAKRGRLRMNTERAGEVMWTLASHDVSSMLRGQQGWSTDAYSAWLEDTLTRTLLP